MTRIELVLKALNIEIVTRRGTRGWTHCVFHKSETPTTFFIRLFGRREGNCWCFSCKKGGSLANLVMHVRKIEYEEAKEFIESLGKSFKPPSAKVTVKPKRANLGRYRFQMPSEIITEPLEDWVTPARDYARSKKRQISPEEVKEFKLGYTVDGYLIPCRIVIPWIDMYGNFGGYSARTYIDEEPKYKTPPERSNPDLGIMVGEHLWHSRDRIVVTEGALNGFAVRRIYPNTNVGALGGSEINSVHIIKLATFKEVIVLTDPDEAGNKAAAQLDGFLGNYVKLTRIELPSEKDALDLYCKDPKILRRFLKPVLEA